MYPKGNLFVPASHGHLEAILKEPTGEIRGAALVCHPHPLGGGTMHNKVVYRAAAGLIEAGLITLRFNFRGVGDSTGEHDDGNGEKDDVRDALNYLTENERVVRLVSIGTPVDKYDFSFLKNCRKPILFVHGDRDEFGSLASLNSLVVQVAENAETKLIIFENCGHFFDNHLEQLKNTVRDWVLERI
jgi:alpha/beta superfamily hydrolase